MNILTRAKQIAHGEARGNKFVDISGERYGSLVVVKFSKMGKHSSHWICQCDCGNLKEVSKTGLKCGTTTCADPASHPRMESLAGKRFGFLVAETPTHTKGRSRRIVAWECKCDCGNRATVGAQRLKSGNTKSCGCLAKLTQSRLSHGFCRKSGRASEYTSWSMMKNRCSNPKANRYHNYGGRGIKVCKRWNKFENFLADMGLKPTPKHSLERINNNGDYEPSNCRWATPKEQGQNTSTNVMLEVRGFKRPLTTWAVISGIKSSTIHKRIKMGWSAADAIFKPLKTK